MYCVMYWVLDRVPPPGTRLGRKGARLEPQAVFLFAKTVFLFGRYTAREPCTVIGIPEKAIFSVHMARESCTIFLLE
jgi:hypothetical protein